MLKISTTHYTIYGCAHARDISSAKGKHGPPGTRLQMSSGADGHQTEYDIQTGGACNQAGIAGHSHGGPSDSGFVRFPRLSPHTENVHAVASSAASVERCPDPSDNSRMAEGLSDVGENENQSEVDTTTNVRILS